MNDNGKIYVCIERPEGYDDVHPDLVLADARIGFPYEDVTEEVAALEAENASMTRVGDEELAGIAARLDGEARDEVRSESWLIGWDGQDADMAKDARIAELEAQLAEAHERLEDYRIKVELWEGLATASGHRFPEDEPLSCFIRRMANVAYDARMTLAGMKSANRDANKAREKTENIWRQRVKDAEAALADALAENERLLDILGGER